MPTLIEAYRTSGSHVLTQTALGDSGMPGEQRGGTCGLYSLWYATILLGFVNLGGGRNPIFPRKHLNKFGMSSRKFAKSIGSGQGEVLNWYEMRRIINEFGYECDVADEADENGRRRFITFCLEKTRPILMAYMEGGNPGQDCYPARAYDALRPNDFGPHWCLLIDENNAQYGIIDPHWPNTARYYNKDDVLKSNAAADDQGPFPASMTLPVRSEKQGGMKSKTYDLRNPAARQTLKNLLVSVY